MMNFDFRALNKFIGLSLFVSILSSCGVDKTSISDAQISWNLSKDLEKTFTMQEPIDGDVDIYEAIARALKYNLDDKVNKFEQAIELSKGKLSSYQMLPNIAANAGYSARSEKLSYDGFAEDGSGRTFKPTVFEQKNKALAELDVSWNVLDFGVGYVNAKQEKDRVYIAQELRRKAIQNIVYDVRRAYWKALAAQKTEADINKLISEVKLAIKDTSVKTSAEKEEENLSYQKELLSQLQKLNKIKQKIVTAKYELASLMNVDPAIDFKLALDKRENDDGLSLPIRELETIALIRRPEIKIAKYDIRISREEIDKEFLRLLPGIEIMSSLNYDSNKYLNNQSWADAGLQVSFNLINTIMGNDNIDIAKNKFELEKAKALALNVAVLTQVNVSYAKLKEVRSGYDLAKQHEEVSLKLYKHQASKAKSHKLEVIKNKIDLLNSFLSKEYAYAQYQDADSRLYNSIGVDPVPEVTTNSSVDLISNILRQTVGKWNNIEFRKKKIQEIQEEILKYKNAKNTPIHADIDSSWTDDENWLDDGSKKDDLLVSVEDIDFVDPSEVTFEEEVVPSKIVPLTTPKPKKIIKKSSRGEYLQLGAYVKENNAYKDWKRIVSKHKFLSKYKPEIRRIRIHGVDYNRMMIKDTKNEIRRLYKLLKSMKTDCIIR